MSAMKKNKGKEDEKGKIVEKNDPSKKVERETDPEQPGSPPLMADPDLVTQLNESVQENIHLKNQLKKSSGREGRLKKDLGQAKTQILNLTKKVEELTKNSVLRDVSENKGGVTLDQQSANELVMAIKITQEMCKQNSATLSHLKDIVGNQRWEDAQSSSDLLVGKMENTLLGFIRTLNTPIKNIKRMHEIAETLLELKMEERESARLVPDIVELEENDPDRISDDRVNPMAFY